MNFFTHRDLMAWPARNEKPPPVEPTAGGVKQTYRTQAEGLTPAGNEVAQVHAPVLTLNVIVTVWFKILLLAPDAT